MSQRFFVETPIEGDRAELRATEAQHAVKVMRCRVGDEAVLFDGSGAEFPARISRIERTTVHLDVLQRRVVDRELARRVTIGVALPKGDRQRWLIEKAVELGIAKVVPLITQRGVAQPGAKTLTRLRRTVIEASKQCGRNRLMQIADPMPLTAFGESVRSVGLRLFATPAGRPWTSSLSDAAEIAACIGPEGGFSDEERRLALAGDWTPVALGQRILRVETAAVTIAAALSLVADP